MSIFSERLKYTRDKLKKNNSQWTQGYVADKIGVARPSYTAYERGTKQPPLETVNKLADLFNVTADYLLGRVDEPDDIMSVAYSRGGHNFTEEEKKYLESVMDDEIEKFLRIRKQFLEDKKNEGDEQD